MGLCLDLLFSELLFLHRERKIWAYFGQFGLFCLFGVRLQGGGVPKLINIRYAIVTGKRLTSASTFCSVNCSSKTALTFAASSVPGPENTLGKAAKKGTFQVMFPH